MYMCLALQLHALVRQCVASLDFALLVSLLPHVLAG